jgi:hypothetical protein
MYRAEFRGPLFVFGHEKTKVRTLVAFSLEGDLAEFLVEHREAIWPHQHADDGILVCQGQDRARDVAQSRVKRDQSTIRGIGLVQTGQRWETSERCFSMLPARARGSLVRMTTVPCGSTSCHCKRCVQLQFGKCRCSCL